MVEVTLLIILVSSENFAYEQEEEEEEGKVQKLKKKVAADLSLLQLLVNIIHDTHYNTEKKNIDEGQGTPGGERRNKTSVRKYKKLTVTSCRFITS